MTIDSNSTPTRRIRFGVFTTALLVLFLGASVTAAFAIATNQFSPDELNPEQRATLDAQTLEEQEVIKGCPVFGQQLTDQYLASIGLETPGLPEGLANSAIARAIHCRVTQGRIVQIQIDVTSPGEPHEMWSSIFIGPAGEKVEGHDAGEILSSIESEAKVDKPPLSRQQLSSNSLLAIDPMSSLSDYDDESPSGSIGELTTRWSK